MFVGGIYDCCSTPVFKKLGCRVRKWFCGFRENDLLAEYFGREYPFEISIEFNFDLGREIRGFDYVLADDEMFYAKKYLGEIQFYFIFRIVKVL